ncbi:luciferin 4-monooxygenase-like [Tenebrio molitor]|jgi:4-coumarate--CoA ligase|uniref:luciferin 4-monooxygenase-like n=1 Tax=Tenebrio molitor TaxID=7067 RepID=UPI003624AA2D
MAEKCLHGPQLKSPVLKQSMGELFFYNGDKHAGKLCQVDAIEDTTETFASVKLRSTRVAIDLQKRGITSSDVIAFCAGNTLDTVIPILATMYLGAKVANLEPSLSIRQTQHLIGLVSPKIIFVEEGSVSLIENSLNQAKVESEIIVYGKSNKYSTLLELTRPKQNEDDFRPAKVHLDDVILLLFSSGTTGLPKAIAHTHKSFMYIGCCLRDYDVGNSVFHATSFYWITANFMLIFGFIKGACRVFARSLEPESTFRAIEKYKVDTMFLAPILSNKLTSFANSKNFDTSSLRLIHCGGSAMTLTQYQNLVITFPHTKVCGIYGLTEIGVTSVFHPETDKDLIPVKPTSCGKPFYTMKIKIVDVDTEEALGANQEGEIRILSPCLFKGYHNGDSSGLCDKDGFLKCGDLGYYDEDGCLYVVERLKEMFKYQSWHIVPTAIEAVLVEHPAVKEAVVFGVPWGDDGEAPAACVVLESGTNTTAQEIEEFVANKVSDRERLRGGVVFVTSLLKTPTGKFMRKEIRKCVLNK